MTNFDHLNIRRMARVSVIRVYSWRTKISGLLYFGIDAFLQDSCCLWCLSHANIPCSLEWCYHILSHPVKQTKLINLHPSTTNNSTCTQRGQRLITPFILGRGQERKGAGLVFWEAMFEEQSLELLGFRSYMSETLWSCCRIAQVLVLARRKRQPRIKPAIFLSSWQKLGCSLLPWAESEVIFLHRGHLDCPASSIKFS